MILRPLLDAENGSRLARERFLEPDAFNERRVLDQAEQCRCGIDQSLPCLLICEAVQRCVEHLTVLIEEDLNLLVERQNIYVRGVDISE